MRLLACETITYIILIVDIHQGKVQLTILIHAARCDGLNYFYYHIH